MRIAHCAFCIALAVASATASTDPGFFGVCEHFADQTDVKNNCARLMARMSHDGVKWTRADFRWRWIEPTQGTWSWAHTDAVMDKAWERGVNVLPILCYGSWYTGNRTYVPSADMDLWTNYVTKVVQRYTTRHPGQLTAVEVWNEPDITSFWTGTAAEYATLLQRTYSAVKAVAPSVTVVLGGLTSGNWSYLSTLYGAGIKNYCDVIAFHPYCQPNAPDADLVDKDYYRSRSGNWLTGYSYTYYGQLEYRIRRFRDVMSENGDGSKPIWLTEMGWPTSGKNSVSEADQGAHLTRAMEIARDNGVEKFFVYELVAEEYDSDCERHFGVLHNEAAGYQPKSAWGAVRDYIYGETHGGATDPYANHVFLLASDNYETQSFATSNNWSDCAAPHSDADYIVEDVGSTSLALWHYGGAAFGGRSLTVGRVGGAMGRVRNIGWDSTMTVGSLALNNGSWVVAAGDTAASGATLAGAVRVNAPASSPFVFTAAATNAFTLASTLSGASDTGLRFMAKGSTVFDTTFTGSSSGFSGVLTLDGANVTGAFASAALAGSGGIVLTNGATFRPATSGLTLSTRALNAAGATAGVIDVPSGDTFTLAAPVSGTFLKTGAGTLVLDGGMTGNGRIAVRQGVVRVDIDTTQFISAIEGGQVVYCVPAGSLNSAQSIATVTVPGPLAPGDVVVSNGAAAPGWTASVRYETDGHGDCTAYIDVAADTRITMGADSFEAYAVGTAADSLTGWTGNGAVAAGTPDIGNPPGVPLPNETHTRILALDGDATRTYAGAFARDNQSVDMLVQVHIAADSGWRERIASDSSAQLRIAFDEAGHPWALHGDDAGTATWSRLHRSVATSAAASGGAVAKPPSFASGSWIRVSVDFDYTTASAAYAQIRIEGREMFAADGAASPGAATTGGSWLKLPNAATTARKVSSIEFTDTVAVDDLVYRCRAAGIAPDFAPFGGTDLGGIPRSWFDAYGIARDPAADPDGDGFTNRSEWSQGTDPSDPESCPPHRTFLVVH